MGELCRGPTESRKWGRCAHCKVTDPLNLENGWRCAHCEVADWINLGNRGRRTHCEPEDPFNMGNVGRCSYCEVEDPLNLRNEDRCAHCKAGGPLNQGNRGGMPIARQRTHWIWEMWDTDLTSCLHLQWPMEDSTSLKCRQAHKKQHYYEYEKHIFRT